MMSLKFFVYSKQNSVHSENRHHAENRSSGRLQEVKNNCKIIKLAGPKSGRGRSQEVVVYQRFQL